MKLLFLLLSFGLLVLSCKKERTIHITAKNAVTGQPYAGLTYYVVQEMTSGDGEKTKTVATGTLDSNGETYLTKKLPKAYSYKIRVEPPANVCYNKQITFYFANQETNFDCPFEFAECTYLTLSVNNINCQGSSDKILFDLQPTYIPNYNNIIPTEKLGCYSNTFVESQVPFGQWEATWEVTRNGVTSYHDSIFTIGKEEHFLFTINY